VCEIKREEENVFISKYPEPAIRKEFPPEPKIRNKTSFSRTNTNKGNSHQYY
jgi:hypothetical protein